MKNITILGSTGSIGTQTLEVIDYLGNWNVKVLSAYQNIDLLYKQIKKYKPDFAVVANEASGKKLKQRLANHSTDLYYGKEALKKAAEVDVDLLLNAVVGFAGLEPSIKAAESGNDIALANKESLVSGGQLLMDLVQQNNLKLLPVDSEHNAVFQLLSGHDSELSEIILTASGGPFLEYSKNELENVSVKDALNHPNWDMGSKISIDSASMMNKGLEVIEAHWLFDLAYDDIKVLVHPQSIVHSMIRLLDGTLFAEMGPADMKIPIQYCLTYPERKTNDLDKLNLEQVVSLEFYAADLEKFPALKYAYQAGKAGGTYPAVLNAANEEAVYSFLREEIPFPAISEVSAKVLDKHQSISNPNLEEILDVDREARNRAVEVINKCY